MTDVGGHSAKVRQFAQKAICQGCVGSMGLRYGNLTEDGDASIPFLDLGSGCSSMNSVEPKGAPSYDLPCK